jgi:hypothetical protein
MIGICKTPTSILGIVIFLIFSFLQFKHHIILTNLRKTKEKIDDNNQDNEGKKFYAIPHGLIFNYCGSPHYFCEIIIYLSFIIITKGEYLLP